MRTKITEIKEVYSARRRVRNADGTYEMKEVQLTRFKPVNYIETGARFGAFLLDFVFILIFEFIIGIVIAVVVALFGDLSALDSQAYDLSIRALTWLFIRPLFYIIFEGAFQATPAKLILGRVVVDEYGEKPSWGQIIGRSYARIVPFEAFSCFSALGWHDSWSGTMVLKKEDLKGLKLAIQLQEIGKPETMPNRETPIA